MDKHTTKIPATAPKRGIAPSLRLIESTVDRYGRLIPGALDEATQLADAYLAAAGS